MEPLCACGHTEGEHDADSTLAPCLVADCLCICFDLAPTEEEEECLSN